MPNFSGSSSSSNSFLSRRLQGLSSDFHLGELELSTAELRRAWAARRDELRALSLASHRLVDDPLPDYLNLPSGPTEDPAEEQAAEPFDGGEDGGEVKLEDGDGLPSSVEVGSVMASPALASPFDGPPHRPTPGCRRPQLPLQGVHDTEDSEDGLSEVQAAEAAAFAALGNRSRVHSQTLRDNGAPQNW